MFAERRVSRPVLMGSLYLNSQGPGLQTLVIQAGLPGAFGSLIRFEQTVVQRGCFGNLHFCVVSM